MPKLDSVRSLVAASAIGSVPLAYGCVVLSLWAVNFDFAALDNPASQVGIGAQAAGPLYWSMILDLVGYYLLLLPSALYIWFWLRPHFPFAATLCTITGLGYVFVGAIGAAILAAVWPSLIRDYAVHGGVEQERVAAFFAFASNFVYRGMWNMVEMFLAGVWWVGVGRLLWPEYRAFGGTTMVLGLACLVDSIGSIVGAPAAASFGLYLYLVLAPLWAGWLGVLVARGAGPSQIDLIA